MPRNAEPLAGKLFPLFPMSYELGNSELCYPDIAHDK